MMSAIVCGKRANSIFEELHHSPPSSKRIRCSSSPIRLSLSPSSVDRALSHLRSLFPDMDQEVLERALKACGNDLDSTIKSLNDLCLEASVVSNSNGGTESSFPPTGEGLINNASGGSLPTAENLPVVGSEWVDLFVREMINASDVDDARVRASRVLETLERSILDRANEEAMQNFHKENMVLKEQVEALLRENNILKRAVTIQHERQKLYDERNQEVQNLKQLVSQYQEQLRTLEVNNYALSLHLRQAQQSSSIPGRFNPDVF